MNCPRVQPKQYPKLNRYVKSTLAFLVAMLIYMVIMLTFFKAMPTTQVYYSVSQDRVVKVMRHGQVSDIAIDNNEPYETVYVK